MTASDENDVLGWISWVKAEVIQRAHKQLAVSLNPADFLPVLEESRRFRGTAQLVPPMIVLRACQMDPDIDQIRAAFPTPVAWEDGKASAEGNRFAFTIRAGVNGYAVGRYGYHLGITGVKYLEWRVQVPILEGREFHKIDAKGMVTDDSIPDLDAAKLYVERQFVKETLKWFEWHVNVLLSDPWA